MLRCASYLGGRAAGPMYTAVVDTSGSKMPAWGNPLALMCTVPPVVANIAG